MGCLCECVCLCLCLCVFVLVLVCMRNTLSVQGMYVGNMCKCINWCVFLCAANACFCVLLCVTHVVGLCLHFFLFFFNMSVLGCVFVCDGLRAQYRSWSLWSLRGSFSPALPPVSVLVWAPGATMTAQPSRFAHQVHQIGSLT